MRLLIHLCMVIALLVFGVALKLTFALVLNFGDISAGLSTRTRLIRGGMSAAVCCSMLLVMRTCRRWLDRTEQGQRGFDIIGRDSKAE